MQILGLQGIVYGSLKLDDTIGHPKWPTETSYLLQIYAGYFLMLLLVWLFCLDAAIFTRYRVNYQYVLPRHWPLHPCGERFNSFAHRTVYLRFGAL